MDATFLEFQAALSGRYSLDRELGRGGMGVVYLAREVRLDRPVAIKLLPPDRAADAALRESFLQEARLAARLSHPHVVPIFEVHGEGRFVYYVMAWVDGESLAQRVKGRGPLGTAEGIRVMREVSWALGHAHAHGLVHRDVKPDNVLLEAGSGRVLVVDFGIAAAAGTVEGALRGTPEFMSPEQVLGHPVDARSDLYSLGATMFFALTGRLPFTGANPTEVMAHQVATRAPRVGSMGVPIGRRLAEAVDRCLAKDPDQRLPSANALADQLADAVERRPELPAALRAFVKGGARANGAGSILTIIGSMVGGAQVSDSFPGFLGVTASLLSVVTAGWMVSAATWLRRRGFVHADLAPAFASELATVQEERHAEHGSEPGPVERFLKVVVPTAWAGVALFALGSIGRILVPFVDNVADAAIIAWVVALLSSLAYAYLRGRREDLDAKLWAEVWRGRPGRMALGIASRLVGSPGHVGAMTHRATELALGLAAEDLFAALPAELRASLGDVPALVTALREHATALRERLSVERRNPTAAADAPEIRVLREDLEGRLERTVSALEGIRLELLRLKVGEGSIEGLTTQLGLAAEVSDQVRRLVDARAEVDRTLARGARPVIAG